MTSRISRRCLPGVLAASLGCATASAALAQAEYESVFADYRSFRQAPAPLEWRDANRQAGQLGGFLGQMRAAPRLPAPAEQRPAASAPSPRMTGVAEMVSRLRAGEGK